jgi:hypothetical protein
LFAMTILVVAMNAVIDPPVGRYQQGMMDVVPALPSRNYTCSKGSQISLLDLAHLHLMVLLVA